MSFARGSYGPWLGRNGIQTEEVPPEITRPRIQRIFYRATLHASFAQFAAGPWVYFTLPRPGVTTHLTLAILAGVACAIGALILLKREIASPDAHVGRHLWPITGLLAMTVVFMATGRHLYREERLRPHHELIHEKTRTFQESSKAARLQTTKGNTPP